MRHAVYADAMAFSTSVVGKLFASLDGRWPSSSDPELRAERERTLESLLDGADEAVCDALVAHLQDPLMAGHARTTLGVLELAAGLGWTPREWLDRDRLRFDGPMGRTWVVGIATVGVATSAETQDARKRALQSALDVAFGHRRYGLWLRQSLDAELDGGAISKAVTLWLSAIDRGEWSGVHAVYEDVGISFELVLLEGEREQTDGACFLVNPLGSLDRVNAVGGQLVELVSRHGQTHGDVPLVVAIGGQHEWRVSDGFARQLLFGTPDWVRSVQRHTEYAFPAESRALFADPVMGALSTVWWICPTGPGVLDFTTHSHENPWCLRYEGPEPIPGPRFCAVGLGEGSRGRSVTVMAWENAGGKS